MADYNIREGSTIFLMFSLSGGKKIYVEDHNGKTITLDVGTLETIGDVKAKIQDMESIPSHLQSLFFSGNVLVDGRTLADYNIKEESTLSLISRIRG